MNRTDRSLMTTMRRIVRRAVMTAALAIAAVAPAVAQNGADDFRIGVYGFGSFLLHDADFRTLPGVGCCGPGFESGSGYGYGAGFLLHMPIVQQLAVQFRGGYSFIGGELATEEHIGNAMQGEVVVDAYSEHRIRPSLGILSVEPTLSIRPFRIPLAINVGAELGYVATREYEQHEALITPHAGTFENGSRIRNASAGTIPDADPLYLAAVGGLSYDIDLSRNVILSPELSFHHQLNNVLKDSAWKAHAIRVGASLAWRVTAPSAPQRPLDNHVLAASVRASGVQSNGTESPIVEMRVEEFMSTGLRPLLNYVFFDEGSADIPARYNALDRSQAARFTIDGLHDRDALTTYHDMLNVVGRRMTDDPKATIRIVGCNDDAGEKGNTALSRERAEAVRDYLRDTWGIAEKRMRVESRNLPEIPSNVADADGLAENRRVEIIADRPSITSPVVTNDTLRVSDPPQIRFRTNINSSSGVARWTLRALQGGRTLRELGGDGEVPPVIDWSLERDRDAMPRGDAELEYQLSVVDNDGRELTTPFSAIDVEQITLQRKRAERVADREIDRFSLILFDFGRSDLGEANRGIAELIRKRITKGSTVEITGHTDRVGDAEVNRSLSRDRAMTVARALGVGYENARGVGESTGLYDNDLPEGRFYCRIVNVTVETPVR
jgi:outer membrane protein OmpA-like peptidoglycan-associated protein